MEINKEMESGYYWVIQDYGYSWEIAYYNKVKQYFLFCGRQDQWPFDAIGEIDPIPIKRKEI